jgi:tripartite-type tricarboxylate transporter receptor subunit TctC
MSSAFGRERCFRATCWAALLASAPLIAQAQTYPSGPIRLLLPYPPGGASDFVGRTVASKLGDNLGQHVVVDNRAGSGGSIAMEIAAKATPDGHTLIFAMTAQVAINPALYPKLPYDPLRDFVPVILMTRAPYVLTVHPTVPAHSIAELVSLAKAKPGQLNFFSTGNGSAPHLSMEMLKMATGIDVVHVPYRGSGVAWPDYLAGRVQMTFATYASVSPHISAKRLRALGVSSPERIKVFPELPTVAEQGVPGYESGTWHGIMAPSRTPRIAIERLHAETSKALRTPEVTDRFAAGAIEIIASTPEGFGAYIRSEMTKWAGVVKRSGAKID